MRFTAPGGYPMKAQTSRNDRPDAKERGRNGAGLAISKDYGAGRSCAVCERSISRYNPGDTCASCHQRVPIRDRKPVRS